MMPMKTTNRRTTRKMSPVFVMFVLILTRASSLHNHQLGLLGEKHFCAEGERTIHAFLGGGKRVSAHHVHEVVRRVQEANALEIRVGAQQHIECELRDIADADGRHDQRAAGEFLLNASMTATCKEHFGRQKASNSRECAAWTVLENGEKCSDGTGIPAITHNIDGV